MTWGPERMTRKLLFLLLLGLLWTGAAHAQYQTNGWHFAGMFGFIFTDGDRMTDDGHWGNLAIGKTISHDWLFEVELNADSQDFEAVPITGDLEHTGLAVNFIKVNRNASWNPYFLIGVGALERDDGFNTSTNPMINIGVGGMWPLGSGGIGLRLDLRYRYDFDSDLFASESGFGDAILSFGVTVPFGGSNTTVGRQPAQPR